MSRPKPGAYVYDFVGLGITPVPEGTQLTETIAASGNIDVIDVTTNRNDNQRRIRLQWEADRVVQLSNATVIRGEQKLCEYDPPLEVLHIPLFSENFEDQHFQGSACEQTVKISVLDLDSVKDATGRSWPVWQIEVRGESAGRLESETRWFSPELGRDIRVETTTQTGESESQTARVLSRYPSPV